MEGGGTEHAAVGIMAGSCLGAAALEIESETGGGTIQIKGDVLPFTGDERVALWMVGNPFRVAIRSIV